MLGEGIAIRRLSVFALLSRFCTVGSGNPSAYCESMRREAKEYLNSLYLQLGYSVKEPTFRVVFQLAEFG